jgi:hypothetical protein
MKKTLLFLSIVALILAACATTVTANDDGYYTVTLISGNLLTCEHILWRGDYLTCDSHWPIHRSKVYGVTFVNGGAQ